MLAAALALQLALASPGLESPSVTVPSLAARLDPGPFGGGELMLASVGALTGELLAAVGQVAALATGYFAAPRFWLILPVQLATVSLGASYRLHWGRRAPPAAAATSARREPGDPAPSPPAASLFTPLCPDA